MLTWMLCASHAFTNRAQVSRWRRWSAEHERTTQARKHPGAIRPIHLCRQPARATKTRVSQALPIRGVWLPIRAGSQTFQGERDMKTISIDLYTFDELSDKSKEKARNWYRTDYPDSGWWECTYDDARTA